MEAWAANNMWWLLPAIGIGFVAWQFHDSEGSFLHRVLYYFWPSLEPGSTAQRRSVNIFVGWVITAIIAAIVVIGFLI